MTELQKSLQFLINRYINDDTREMAEWSNAADSLSKKMRSIKPVGSNGTFERTTD